MITLISPSKFYLSALLVVCLFCGIKSQLVVPGGEWNLTNNVFPRTLAPVYPYYNSVFITQQMRSISYVHSGIFDTWTAYDSKAVGRYFGGELRRPVSERTTRNKNIAMAFLLLRVHSFFYPGTLGPMQQVLSDLKLDYNFTGENPNVVSGDLKAAAIGNKVASAVKSRAANDGFNQFGDIGRTYFRTNFSDYTGYAPSNTAYNLVNPDKWQPNFAVDPKSRQVVQAFTTPQFAFTRTFHTVINKTTLEPLKDTYREQLDHRNFKKKVDDVIEAVASLTDYQKVSSEFFDNKLFGLGTMARFLYGNSTYEIDKYMSTVPLVNIAMLESMTSCWYHKLKYDSVRPFAGVRKLYAGKSVRSYGGPGVGTVNIKAEEWRSYLITDSFPDYPSGTACLCWAFAGAAKEFLGRNSFGFSYTFPAGSSTFEPGITPKQNTTLYYATFDDMATECALTRFWGGVHFKQTALASRGLCEPIGKNLAIQHRKLVNGIKCDVSDNYENDVDYAKQLKERFGEIREENIIN